MEKQQRRRRIKGRIGVGIATILAVTTAVFAVIGAISLVTAQGDQNAYDKAPYCTAGTTDAGSCVLRTTADVVYVDVSKNTGKSAHGYTTSAYLDTHAGQNQTVVLDSTQDVSSQVSVGDKMPVLVWHDKITRFTFSGKTHDSDENPHHIVGLELIQVALCLVVAACFGRLVIRRALRSRIAINFQRNRIPDWTLAAVVPVTGIAAILRASYVVVEFGLAGVTVLVLSAAWPFVPWVATHSKSSRPYLSGPRSSAAAAAKKQKQQTVRTKPLP
jgi:hypothetical protein